MKRTKLLTIKNDELETSYTLTQEENGDYTIINNSDEYDYYYFDIGNYAIHLLDKINDLVSSIYGGVSGSIACESKTARTWLNYYIKNSKHLYGVEFNNIRKALKG